MQEHYITTIPAAIWESYREIELISGQQLALLQSTDSMENLAEPLKQLGDRRQSCMDVIDAWIKDKDNHKPVSASDQDKLDDLIKRTLSCDNKSQELLRNIISQTSHKLVTVQGMKKANRAYNEPTSTNNPWFIDRKR